MKQKDRQSLIKSHDELARVWAAKDLRMLTSFFAEDAVMLSAARGSTEGRKAIEEFLGRVFQLPDFSTQMQMTRAEISGCGSIGWTLGSYESSAGGTAHRGNYVAVWRRGQGGPWQVAAYSSNPLPK